MVCFVALTDVLVHQWCIIMTVAAAICDFNWLLVYAVAFLQDSQTPPGSLLTGRSWAQPYPPPAPLPTHPAPPRPTPPRGLACMTGAAALSPGAHVDLRARRLHEALAREAALRVLAGSV